MNSSILALAKVAVFLPFGAISSNLSISNTGSPNDFLTLWSCSSRWANAAVTIDFIYAGRAKCTRRRLTLVYIYATVWAGETRSTLATVPVFTIHTRPGVVAWVWVAVVGILGAGGSFPAFLADAVEGVAVDHTGASVLTWVGQAAAVVGYVTCGTIPARWAPAFEDVPFIMARASIVACGFVTLAITGVAGFSLPAISTFAVEIVHQVLTCSLVQAGVQAAVIYVDFAVNSFPTVSTNALINVHLIDASPTVATWVTFTVVYIFMTVGASETFLTLARKLAPGLASAAPVRATDVGGDISHPVRRTVGCHGNSAAVNHLA